MAMGKKALGKGLDALLGDYSMDAKPEGLREVDIYLIDTNAGQPRKTFDEEKLSELAESIKLHGIVQPIVVRQNGDRFTIVAGERRYRASRMAGLATVPVVIKDIDDYRMMELALIENIQREDLNPIEEASAIRFLMAQHDLTQEEAAERLAKSRPAIANSLRLLNLPEDVQDMLKQGKLQAGHARAILSMPGDVNRRMLANRIAEQGMSVREAEKLAKSLHTVKEEKPPRERRANDPDLRTAEDNLRSRLGPKVSILGNQKKGKVVIEYYSRDELAGIYDLLIKE